MPLKTNAFFVYMAELFFSLRIMKAAAMKKLVKEQNGGFFFSNKALEELRKAAFGSKTNTLETFLTDLGCFPLPETEVPKLKEQLNIDSETLTIPAILAKSQVPVYYNSDFSACFLPKLSFAVCRYFSNVWYEEMPGDLDEVFTGLAIIDSFVGEYK